MKHAKRSPKFDLALELMLAGIDDTEIAQRINMSRTTIWRWRNSAEAVAFLSAHRNREMERLSERMSGLADRALDVLEDVLNDPKAGSMAKLRAATVVLDRIGLTERSALEDRQRRITAESERAQYLDDLEDPLSVANLLSV